MSWCWNSDRGQIVVSDQFLSQPCSRIVWLKLYMPLRTILCLYLYYKVLPKISENSNIPRKPLTLRTCNARCLVLYLSTVSQPTCIFIRARVSEFWLFSLHRFYVCVLISKWRMLRSKEFALNFASSSTKLQLKPTEC